MAKLIEKIDPKKKAIESANVGILNNGLSDLKVFIDGKVKINLEYDIATGVIIVSDLSALGNFYSVIPERNRRYKFKNIDKLTSSYVGQQYESTFNLHLGGQILYNVVLNRIKDSNHFYFFARWKSE